MFQPVMEKILLSHQSGIAAKRLPVASDRMTLMGMRQLSSLSNRLPLRREIVLNYLLDIMTDAQIQDQIEIGREFICGYRPGVIASAKDFEFITANSSMSAENLALVRKVLVDGTPLSALEISSLKKQEINQGCITVCRRIAGIERYRTKVAKMALDHCRASVSDDAMGDVIFSMLTGFAPERIAHIANNDSDHASDHAKVEFTAAAYCSLLMRFPAGDLQAMAQMIQAINDQLDWLDRNILFRASKIFGSLVTASKSKAMSALVSDEMALALRHYMLTVRRGKNNTMDDLRTVYLLYRALEGIVKDVKSTRLPFFVLRGVPALNYSEVDQRVESGERTLYELASEFSRITELDVTTLFNGYKRWKERLVNDSDQYLRKHRRPNCASANALMQEKQPKTRLPDFFRHLAQ